MKLICPKNHEFEWEPPNDTYVMRRSPTEKPARTYAVRCPTCNIPMHIDSE